MGIYVKNIVSAGEKGNNKDKLNLGCYVTGYHANTLNWKSGLKSPPKQEYFSLNIKSINSMMQQYIKS